MQNEIRQTEVLQIEKKVWVSPNLEILEVKHTYADEWEFITSPEGFWKRQLMGS